MILYGASGHARVIMDCLKSRSIGVILFFDDDRSKELFMDIKVQPYHQNTLPQENLIISVGNNIHRKQIAKKVSHAFGKIIHPSSIVAEDVMIGNGSVVFHNTVIQTGTSVGSHCIINTSSNIDHECILEDFIHISPNATLCGNVRVGEGTQIGAGAVVLPSVSIGQWCIIGAGTIVTKNVPDFSVWAGNPGRLLKKIDHE